jgi:hypothetical protein
MTLDCPKVALPKAMALGATESDPARKSDIVDSGARQTRWVDRAVVTERRGVGRAVPRAHQVSAHRATDQGGHDQIGPILSVRIALRVGMCPVRDMHNPGPGVLPANFQIVPERQFFSSLFRGDPPRADYVKYSPFFG